MAPDEMFLGGSDQPRAAAPPQLPVLVVNGWVLSANTPVALEQTILQNLSPERQMQAWRAGAPSCGKAKHAAAPQPRDVKREILSAQAAFESLFCPAP